MRMDVKGEEKVVFGFFLFFFFFSFYFIRARCFLDKGDSHHVDVI